MNHLKHKHLWSNLRASFWFLPSLIIAVSTVLALGLIELDSSTNCPPAKWFPYEMVYQAR